MRSLALCALAAAAVSLAGCGGSTVPVGLVMTWAANGTSGNQYQTLHLAVGANALITVSQDATRRTFTAFLSGGPPNGTAPGAGPATPSSTCSAFALDANAGTSLSEHSVTSLASGTCYLVAYAPTLAYTQLVISTP